MQSGTDRKTPISLGAAMIESAKSGETASGVAKDAEGNRFEHSDMRVVSNIALQAAER